MDPKRAELIQRILAAKQAATAAGDAMVVVCPLKSGPP